MPRTEQPRKPLIGIHPVINCRYCERAAKDVWTIDSDYLFPAVECSSFQLKEYNHCREKGHFEHWKVCAWSYYSNANPTCESCPIGEGMVDMAHTLGYKIPEGGKLK